ncbi:Septin [Basidiobolus meristosporus CBS 931.73]|uniref:Septin n=1 Tax=Basidiobolus meristosporus CBS 931.73 TaxID=1314790 RepID=A0A1Y1Y125_9FUNG|nr:Septin [Basidiobolus meristosporus CBS 931.73]|eukprot:ORX91416.1 Septin [Basidiobolus meristosporus CBS 931.73]
MPLEYALQNRGKFGDAGPWKLPTALQAQLRDVLGIEALPRQICDRAKRKPFVFNIMVVGETGLGKTTFMNTLFNTDLTEEITHEYPQNNKTVAITPTTYDLVEEGVSLHLTVIDTPGFGDQLNREANVFPIVEYIENQFEAYHNAEKNTNFRHAIPDTRVHAVLYFIAPTGKSLKELDVTVLKALSDKANIIPVIAKADTLTFEERDELKQIILRDIEAHQIKIYPKEYTDEPDITSDLEKYIPFAVIGSDTFIDVEGEKMRGRTYRWGSVQVENEEHCDFIHLRALLMDSCLQDLIETTHSKHYALYRRGQLRTKGRPESILECDEAYESRIENTKKNLAEEMMRKEEEMRQNFVAQVRETEALLREREEQLIRKKQEFLQEIEEKRRQLQQEEQEINALLSERSLNYS